MLDNCLIKATVYKDSRPIDVSDYVRRHVGMHELEVGDSSARASLRHATLGNLGLSIISYGTTSTVRNALGISSYHLQIVSSGSCSIRVRNRELKLHSGQAMLLNPQEPTEVSYSADCTKLIVNIPESLFRASSADRFSQLPVEGVRFDPVVTDIPAPGSMAHAIELIYLEADERKDHPGFSQLPLEIFFTTKMLEFFPSNMKANGPIDFDERLFTTIDGYINEHIKEEISAAQLASICNVSQRTLYDRFTLYRGMTPSAYIKEKKFRRIYTQLSDPLLNVRSVTEMALEYGFNHLGRFSADYKTLFSELPSETFKRVRGTRQ